MRKLLLTSAVLAAMVLPAKALVFTVSDFAGTGNFGDITAQFINATDVQISIDMAPNLILDTGSHWAFTASFVAPGTISQASLDSLNSFTFTAQPKTSPADYSNSPFGKFTDAIAGACGSGSSSGGCGSTLEFVVEDWAGVVAATGTFNDLVIFAAVDIFDTISGKTGAVGLTLPLIPTPFGVVPLPAAGWLFLTGMVGLAALSRRRRSGKSALGA